MEIEKLLSILQSLNEITRKSEKEKTSITQSMIGKYVIIRTRNEGLNAGYLVEADETGCVLRDARRLSRFYPKDKKTTGYEGVALSGLSLNSTASTKRNKVIIEEYSITECSQAAQKSIEEHPVYEQE